MCGDCIYHIPMPLGEWICDNDESEYYGLETEYCDGCIDEVDKGE